MIILSHRGYWKAEHEKNSLAAFERSFLFGFGTETDLRDYKNELVVSHDIADDGSAGLDSFFEIYRNVNNDLPLALNIKADGLQVKLKHLLEKYKVDNYFVFDMAVPDTLAYLKHDYNVFTRQSEYENEPALYKECCGVWLDEFNIHWVTLDVIEQHVNNGKKVCIVSPELHKREHWKEWEDYKEIEGRLGINDIMLCTDHPEEARKFFNG